MLQLITINSHYSASGYYAIQFFSGSPLSNLSDLRMYLIAAGSAVIL
jgi:hypothetical protein